MTSHSAFKMLSVYSDSEDDNDEVLSPSASAATKRRSRNSGDRVEPYVEVSVSTKVVYTEHVPLLSEDSGERNNVQEKPSPKAEEEHDHARLHQHDRQRRTTASDWMSDDDEFTRPSEHQSAVDDGDDEEASLKEPPPPARPDDFRTCSPSPAAGTMAMRRRSPTPAKRHHQDGEGAASSSSKAQHHYKMPRVESQTLVSYGEDEEAVEVERRKSTTGAPTRQESEEQKSESDAGGDDDDVSLERSDNTPTTNTMQGDELDSYSLLERCLEKEATAGDSPLTTETELELPPSPKERCDPKLVDRFTEHMRQKRRFKRDFNLDIQRRKDFRNPSIYEKLIEHFQLDELGSNFKPALFDPHGFKPSDYCDELMKSQRVLMDKIEKTDTTTRSTALTAKDAISTVGLIDNKPRRSKWDQPHTEKVAPRF